MSSNKENKHYPMKKFFRRPRALVDVSIAIIAIAAVCFFVHAHAPVRITEDQFPDKDLREQVLRDIDANKDGELSDGETSALTSLVVSDVTDVSGLNVFPALQTLVVRGDKVRSVDISELQSLTRFDAAGAANLTQLTMDGTLSLRTVDVRGTALDELDLSAAGHPTSVLCDPDTKVIGMDKGMTEQRLMTHFEQTSSPDTSNDFAVDAEYNDNGMLVTRSIKGKVNADISYTYGKGGAPERIEVSSPANEGIGNTWDIKYGDSEVDAEGQNGTFIRRGYDGMGRLTTVSINTVGVEGSIICSMALDYDARGCLQTITVDSDGEKTDYVVECNGAAKIELINGNGVTYYWNGTTNNDIAAADLRADSSSVHSTTGDGSFSSSVIRSNDGSAVRIVGHYGETQKSGEDTIHAWGRQTSLDGATVTGYDADYLIRGASAFGGKNTIPVLMRDKTAPSYVVDYWLMDDVDSAVLVAALEAESDQWSIGSTDPIADEADVQKYDQELAEYKKALPNIASETGADLGDVQYALFSYDGKVPPLMAVSDNASGKSPMAVYAIEDGKVTPVLASEDDGEIHVCGDGFFRVDSASGDVIVLHFNGIAMDPIASIENGQYMNKNLGIDGGVASAEDEVSLIAAYPSADSTLEWRDGGELE